MSYTPSTTFFVVVAVLYLFWGTVQTLSLKWADNIDVSDGFTGPADATNNTTVHFQLVYSFAHPFTQAFFMFCAETSCLVVFLGMLVWKKYIAPRLDKGVTGSVGELVQGEDYALPCNPCVWLLPAGADFLASIIQNVGMTLTYASVYQMLRGATVAWIALISYFWLGRRFTKVETWGMAFVVLGLSLVGLSSILTRSGSGGAGDERHPHQMFGNLLIIAAQVLHAYQGVCEERLVHLYHIPPLQMVGTEGLYGIGMTLSLLAFLQLVPTANWGHNLVAVQEYQTATGATALDTNVTWVRQLQPVMRVPYDDVVLAFAQVRASWLCRIFILVYVPAGFFYNACQMNIIKYLSAAATVMLGSLRNVTVWLVCLLLPSIFGEHFNVGQFIGFLFLVLGNVLFQRVWITHFEEILPESVMQRYPALFRDAKAKTGKVEGETGSDVAAAAWQQGSAVELSEKTAATKADRVVQAGSTRVSKAA